MFCLLAKISAAGWAGSVSPQPCYDTIGVVQVPTRQIADYFSFCIVHKTDITFGTIFHLLSADVCGWKSLNFLPLADLVTLKNRMKQMRLFQVYV